MPRSPDSLVLDDVQRLEAADQHGTLRALAMAGAQVRRAATAVREADLAPVLGDGRPRGFVVVARGGGATAAEVLQALAGVGCPVPLVRVDGPRLPGWVGPLDVVAVIDAEGASPYALAAVREADRRGARVLTVAPAHSAVAEAGVRARGAHVASDGIGVTLPERLALWSCVVPLLAVAGAVGLGLDGTSAGQEQRQPVLQFHSELADLLDGVSTRCRPSSESFVNPAKGLALDLVGSLPLLCAIGDDAAVVVRRCVAQLAAAARYPALAAFLPGGAEPLDLLDGVFGRDAAPPSAAVGSGGQGMERMPEDPFDQEDFFRDRGEDVEEARLRLVLVDGTSADDGAAAPSEGDVDPARLRALAVERGIPVTDLAAAEILADPVRPRLDRIAVMTVVTDFACAYLALAYGIDPFRDTLAAPGTGGRPRTGRRLNGAP